MNWENLMAVVDFFKALLTPAIAALTAVIAVAQYRLAEAKFRHELYERRSAVYKATMKFIAQVTSGGNAKDDDLHAFSRDTSEVTFLFKHGTKYNRSSMLSTSKVYTFDRMTRCLSLKQTQNRRARNSQRR